MESHEPVSDQGGRNIVPLPVVFDEAASAAAARHGVNASDVRAIADRIVSTYRAALEVAAKELGAEAGGLLTLIPAPAPPPREVLQLPRMVRIEGAALAERILHAVAIEYKLGITDILGGSHRKKTSQARHVAMYLMRRLADLSLQETAVRCGVKNHTSVMYACERVRMRVELDQEFAALVDRLIDSVSHEERGPEQRHFTFSP